MMVVLLVSGNETDRTVFEVVNVVVIKVVNQVQVFY